jgi:hypothetical protein
MKGIFFVLLAQGSCIWCAELHPCLQRAGAGACSRIWSKEEGGNSEGLKVVAFFCLCSGLLAG